MLAPSHILLSFINGKISLYVIALTLPIIKKFFSYSISCATYSLKRLKGGLVMTTSACFIYSIHSSERKSPSPFNFFTPLFLDFNKLSISLSETPLPLAIGTSEISIT